MRQVLIWIREAGLKLKPSKCRLLQKIKFLAHVVSDNGIECNPDYIFLIGLITKLSNRSKDFLGLQDSIAVIFRILWIARPVHQLTGYLKDKHGKKHPIPWEWTEKHQAAFSTLIKLLTRPTMFAYPDYSKPYELKTDASRDGLGTVLCRQHDGVTRVIAYAIEVSIIPTNLNT